MRLDHDQEQFIAGLYRASYKKLCVCAMQVLCDAAQAEEAVQDTFRIACARVDILRQSQNPQGWLMNTLKNVVQNMVKMRARWNAAVVRCITQQETADVHTHDGVEFVIPAPSALPEGCAASRSARRH